MQPYFFPYIGYFQLLNHVDNFVILDDVQFTKKGWINRNRIATPSGEIINFSLPLVSGSQQLKINQRLISETFNSQTFKETLRHCYSKASNHPEFVELIEATLSFKGNNLASNLTNSLMMTANYLDIHTNFLCASELGVSTEFKGQERIIEICKTLNVDKYINLIGGMPLYQNEVFAEHSIELLFLQSRLSKYPQLTRDFIPGLSIIDLINNLDRKNCKDLISVDFDLVRN